ARGLAQGRGGSLDLFQWAPGRRHGGAFARKRLRDAPADARATARNQCHLALQPPRTPPGKAPPLPAKGDERRKDHAIIERAPGGVKTTSRPCQRPVKGDTA